MPMPGPLSSFELHLHVPQTSRGLRALLSWRHQCGEPFAYKPAGLGRLCVCVCVCTAECVHIVSFDVCHCPVFRLFCPVAAALKPPASCHVALLAFVQAPSRQGWA